MFAKILFLLFFITNLSAAVVEVSVDPINPVINQEFELIFKIQTESQNEPYISFNPAHADVLNKAQRGVSVSTTVIGGRFSTVRQVVYVYRMVTERAGSLLIRDIKVEVDGKEHKVRDVRVDVATEAIVPQEVFLLAEPSNNNAYVGEGIDVRYYLYFRVPVVDNEILEFPKLNNFIKRFHMVNQNLETVEVNGAIYRRLLKYSARLYPEKSGKLIIDPLKMSVQYSEQGGGGFGAFNFSSRRHKTRNIQSPIVDINVLNIPTDNMPSSFTGLVGEHEFKLSVPRTKFLTNEVMEAKLEVQGPGALENLDAPKILSSPGLEEFDVRTDLVEIDERRSKKTFDYTYLTREKMNKDKQSLELSYFVPETGTFAKKVIEIPSFEVEQGSAQASSTGQSKSEQTSSSKVSGGQEVVKLDKVYTLTAPIFDLGNFWVRQWVLIFKWSSTLFFIVALVLYVTTFLRRDKKQVKKLLEDVFKNGANYSSLYHFLNFFFNSNDKKMADVVEESSLSHEAKKYFKDLILEVEKSEFTTNQKKKDFELKRKYFDEVIKKMGNE